MCGRQGDVVFAAGRNVYPQDAEAAAERVRAVRPGGAVAFALPGDPEPRLALVVETDPPAPAGLAADVRAAVVAELGVTPAVVAVAGARRLPRTSSGKLRRAEARRRYLDGGFEPAP